MTEAELAELERLLSEATPSPWHNEETGVGHFIVEPDDDGGPIADCSWLDGRDNSRNAALICFLRNAAPALLSLARRAVKLEWALRIAEQYVRSRHNEGNPSCCTCDSESPRGVCKDLVQIRDALTPEDR